jgi:hypothetical protein
MKRLVFLLYLILSLVGFSQKNLTLFNMRGIPQAVYVNPSFMPQARFYLSLPLGMQNFSVSNSGFVYDDLIKKNADGKNVFNSEKVLSVLEQKNVLTLNAQQELLGVGVKILGFYFNANISHRFNFNFIYPKDLVQFVVEGNGKNLLDKRASLDGLGVNLASYMEYGIGVTKEIGNRFSVGGRVKALSGVANIHTRKSNLGIYTDPTTFDITIDGGAEFNSSNVNGLFAESTRSAALKSLPSSAFDFKNSGVGFDLGFSFKTNNNLTLTASIIDLGSITWNKDVKTYIQKDFNFTFRGVDFNQFLADTTKTPTKALSDTLQAIFQQETNTASYKTGIGTKYYVGAFYNFTKKISVSALMYSQILSRTYIPGVTVGLNAGFMRILTANVNYSYANNSWNNLGLGLSLKLGMVQTYVITDNIFGFISPNKSKLANICFGVSIWLSDKKLGKKIKDAILPGDQSK